MIISPRIDPALILQFRQAGAGAVEPEKSERIVTAILNHYSDRGEITVYDETGIHEWFRIGPPFAPGNPRTDPRHGINGVHIHESNFNPKNRIHAVRSGKAVPLSTSTVRELIVDELLKALAEGHYRMGFK